MGLRWCHGWNSTTAQQFDIPVDKLSVLKSQAKAVEEALKRINNSINEIENGKK